MLGFLLAPETSRHRPAKRAGTSYRPDALLCQPSMDRRTLSPNLHRQILRKARGLLSDKRRWTRYGAARTGSGAVCPPYAPDAVKFCAYGALARAALEVTGSKGQARRLAQSIETMLVGGERAAQPHSRLCHVNDRKGYAAVIALLDSAAEEDVSPAVAPEPLASPRCE